ncbi:MAG: hypothetical protein LBI87_13100, partial [Candidatus Accumulibacter sp.]|nr:hypothetical protein [Accumulibacter sp.]
MKIKIETLKDLVSDTVSTASCKLSSDQGIVGKAGSFVLSAGKSAQQVIDGVLEHEDTKAVIAKAKELSSSTAIEAKKLIGSVADEL